MLNELEQKGIVTRRGAIYYITINGEEQKLGSGKIKAAEALKSVDLSSLKEDNDSKKENLEEDNSGTPLPPLSQVSEEIEDLSSMLSSVKDIKPSNKSTLDITYKGVNVFDYTDPLIAKLGIILRWRRKQDRDTGNLMIDDGKGNFTCNGWTVLNANIFKNFVKDLEILRNDTPGKDFITNGDQVLCVAKREQYVKLQEGKAIEGMVASVKDKERRQEIGKNFSKYSDAEQAAESLGKSNDKDMQEADSFSSQMEELAKQV